MPTNVCIAISSKTLRAMLDFQEEQECEFNPADLAELAICEWLERQRKLAKPQGQRGYFWKKLFLPDGTRLRVSNHRMTRYGAIVGDDLVHDCMTTSPNRFVQSTLGSARNAWNVAYVQMPLPNGSVPPALRTRSRGAPRRGPRKAAGPCRTAVADCRRGSAGAFLAGRPAACAQTEAGRRRASACLPPVRRPAARLVSIFPIAALPTMARCSHSIPTKRRTP
ncbi:hypothetical protein GM658_17605 [Pseudoduganella eburnea]|uniref:Uncharacterized protein n=1 Tax=Massilia eburnea TaxID=1776165 RepID=A0A6L6QKH8_9BURK|nr:hypothetical protein [Massilia eburnea]MTW12427.1 hypothetical protein [Massilia eburnea]